MNVYNWQVLILDLFDPQFYSCFAGILKQTVTGLDKLCRPYQQEIKTKANKHCGGNGSKSEMIKHAEFDQVWCQTTDGT